MGLKLNDVPAAAGLRWVTLAFEAYFRHPLAYTGLFLVFMAALLLAMSLPFIGGVLLLMSVPLLSLAFMMAAHAAMQGRPLGVGVYLAPWKQREPDRRRPLLLLLGAYALLTVAALWFCEWVDAGAFDRLLEAVAKGDTPQDELTRLAEAPGALAGALWRIGLTALLSVPFWFAPGLVFWAGQGPAQAMFSSALAVWRAKGAFLLYGLGWLAAMLLSGMLVGFLLALVGAPATGLIAMPVGLMLSTVFYVSLYFSFRDCFGEPY